MDINKQKFIFFHSPWGTYTRINHNLYLLGLNKEKKIANTYACYFAKTVMDINLEKYKDYDIIYLDEFYDSKLDDVRFLEIDVSAKCYEAMIELANNGKQIVMAGHGDIDSLRTMPKGFKEQVTNLELNYDTDWTYDYRVEYLE